MVKHKCAVIECKNKSRFVFPQNPKIRKNWLKAIRRPDFEPRLGNGLCEAHFTPDQISRVSKDLGIELSRVHLIKGSVPCIFPWNSTTIKEQITTPKEAIETTSFVREVVMIKEEYDVDNNDNYNQETNNSNNNSNNYVNGDINFNEIVEIISNEHCYHYPYRDINKINEPKVISRYNIKQFKDDPQGLYFFTGLDSYQQFMYIFQSLGSKVNTLHYSYSSNVQDEISPENKFFLTLWKLKRNCMDYELGMHFGLSEIAVNVLFKNMILYLTSKWSMLDIWPTKELIEMYIPEGCEAHSTKLENDIKNMALYANVRRNAKKHVKLFKILARKMNPTYVPIATQITSACIMLCNYKEIFNKCRP